MYLENDQVEKGVLRQGDIIAKTHIIGALNTNSIQYASTSSEPGIIKSWSVPAEPKYADAMVLSHSCEIDYQNNNIKVTSIILAPLRDISSATSHEKTQELIDSNIIDPDNPKPSFLKYFYLLPHENLQYNNGAIVDFSKCFSVRKQVYQTLLINKILQLTIDTSKAMALKLALYFSRNNFAGN